MKKLISLFLVFSIISLYGNLNAKERRGADLVIERKNGWKVKGELITVKPDSLLIKESAGGVDVNVRVRDIKKVTVVNKLNKSKGYIGLLVGGAIGAAFGFAQGDDSPTYHSADIISFDFNPVKKAEQKAIAWGLGVGLLGYMIGKAASIDKTFLFEGRNPGTVETNLEKLRKKARVRDFQ
jgi:hypothetical protein